MTIFGCSLLGANTLNFVSVNQECKIRSEIINVNSNKPLFYRYSIKINKCRGSCNSINDLIKNINAKVFNRMKFVNANLDQM